MIERTLAATQQATFALLLPDPNQNGLPVPMGTGFFISPDGFFVTAAHVVTQGNTPGGVPRTDISAAWLMKERGIDHPSAMCHFPELELLLGDYDFALLKLDFEMNANKHWLKGRSSFPYITISQRKLSEGEPVYAFGYPLSQPSIVHRSDSMEISTMSLSPRTTSAIVSSTLEYTKMVTTGADAQVYVIDKALNYGNSGGPIVCEQSGRRARVLFEISTRLHSATAANCRR
ncbi:MAG TPA: serine protease [Candidatus Acidoferrum sp.]|nr:serine protease [Candidatus Acidoferrum sp.]